MRTDYVPRPFLRVTVGTQVVSADYEQLGEVKALAEQGFKVGTGFLRRDYWLASELVAEAVPDAVVLLTVDKAELGERKMYQEPHQAS